MRLDGARTLVTGASGGLGAAIARACAERGASVVLTGRRRDLLDGLASELRADVVAADLADGEDVTRLLAMVGAVDVLVSNAALPAGGRIDSFSITELDRALAVNLRAPMVLSRCLSTSMTDRGHGSIVFVSSLAAAFPTPGLSVYNTTKTALRTYALSLRGELAPKGVGVSVVYPGPIRDAGMWADTGLPTPTGIGTRSPAEMGAAVVRAIENNRGEVTVAPVALRAGAAVARATPGAFARVAPRLGAARVTDAKAQALRDRR